MKVYLLSTILLLACLCTLAQDEGSTTAPKINPFNLQGDNLGGIASSVNLFTGDLNLPLNLVSIPGNGGLGIDISIMYSSANIENIVDVWNQEAPTGILGLGWTFSFPMIVADNKLTGARDDDEFYLLEGGVSTKLICIGNSAGVKTYKTKNYTNWIITFTASSEKWEITREDGSKYIYGDQYSGRNTVQWVIKWDNWIGNSNISSSQRQGLSWSLSEVKNIWGEKMTYTYSNEENFVGAGATNHTQASYLTKVNDSWGREVELLYKKKLPEEYVDPNIEVVEPDAYQERYESKYLDKMIVRSDAVTYYEIQLKYVTHLLGSGNQTKRLLKTILKVTPNGTQSPSTSFDYITSVSPMRGALNKVTLPTGGTVKFDYSDTGIQANHSARDLNLTAPPGYAEPRVFIEDDFAVVTWRQLNGSSHDLNERPVQVFAYSWEGKWRGSDLGSIANVKLLSNLASNFIHDFQVVTSKNFFATLKPIYGFNTYGLSIWHKDEKTPGAWVLNYYNIDLGTHDNTKEQLMAGNDFIAVTNNKGKIFQYVWNGSSWNATTITEPANTHFTTATNNYIISQDTGPNPDIIKLYYLDEMKTWQTQTVSNTFNNGTQDSYWYPSNSFAFVMADGNNEFIYKWNDTYTGIQRIDKGLNYQGVSRVYSINNSQIVIAEDNGTNPDKIRSLRFNGYDWILSNEISTGNVFDSSFGDEYLLWGGSVFNLRTFNANTSSWSVDQTFPREPFYTIFPRAGNNYFYLNGTIYKRNPNDSWSSAFAVPNIPAGFNIGDKYLGANYFASKIVSTTQVDNIYLFFRNGQIYKTFQEANVSPFLDPIVAKNLSRLHPYTIVVGPEGADRFQDKTSLIVRRMMLYDMKGKLIDYPVIRVTQDDGINSGADDHVTSFDYTSSTATFDPSGSSANYNKVTTIPGSSTITAKPFGYTETYFYNRLTQSELGDTFPVESPTGNALSYYKMLTGQPYRVRVFNSGSTLVSETNTIWNVDNSFINNSSSVTVDWGFLVRPYKTISVVNGIETQMHYGYNTTTKQLNFQRAVTKNISGERELVDIEYTYAWEKYSSCQSKNILSPIAQTKKDVNGNTYIESSVTRYKDWSCSGPNCMYANVPAPADQHAWKGTNTSTFTWWDVATQSPSADWVFQAKTLTRDNSCGVSLEQQGQGNQLSCLILNLNKRNVLATISNSALSKVAYSSFESFENAASGNWTTWETPSIGTGSAKTGDQYLNLGTVGLTKSGLVSTDQYTISFWAKSASGSLVVDGVGTINLGNLTNWTLFEYTVTNLTSINIRRTGAVAVQLDEIRIYPLSGRMSTSTYHPMYGSTSSTSASNQTVYVEYDDLGRVKNNRDQKGDIIQTYLYNFKK